MKKNNFNTIEAQMGRVAQKKARCNRQKQARRMNRINQLRKKRRRQGRPLTDEQKKDGKK